MHAVRAHQVGRTPYMRRAVGPDVHLDMTGFLAYPGDFAAAGDFGTQRPRPAFQQPLGVVLRGYEQERETAGQPGQVQADRIEQGEPVKRVPVEISSSARPRASSTSSVLAWTAKACDRLDSSARRSRTVTGTPAAARSPASSKPVGPAPTTSTSGMRR